MGDENSSTDTSSSLPYSSLMAEGTLYSYDDFSGRAAIYKSISDTTPFPIDLLVDDVSFSVSEHLKVEQLLGNFFGKYPFGKDIITINCSGVLINTSSNYGKDYLMNVYKNYLSIEAVARRGVLPIFVWPNAAASVFCSGINLEEDASREDLITVSLSLVATQLVLNDGTNSVFMDFKHGMYSTTKEDESKSTQGVKLQCLSGA